MRVLFVVPMFPFPIQGGLEKQALELAMELVKENVEVVVLSSYFNESQLEQEYLQGIKIYRPKVFNYLPTRSSLSKLIVSLNLIFRSKRILDQLGDFDIAHIHSNSWFSGIFCFHFIRKNIPYISKIPNVGARGIDGVKRNLFGKFRLSLLLKSTGIVAMVPETVDDLKTEKFPISRIIKIPNGVLVNANNIHKVYKQNVKNVAFIGRLHPQKGLIDLIHAWAILANKINLEPIRLNIYGEGHQKRELQNEIIKNNLENKVILCGYSNNINGILGEIDLLVLPSYIEGNSNAILEAMSFGVPIIASNISGNRFQLGKYGKQFLFAPSNKFELAEKLEMLLINYELRKSYGEFLCKRAMGIFNISTTAKNYKNAYTLILEKRENELSSINKEIFN